jgi:hypothetical protein
MFPFVLLAFTGEAQIFTVMTENKADVTQLFQETKNKETS